MNGPELEREEVRELWMRIALRRVLDGRVRCLIGGEICDRGRAVPDYVTVALRELAGNEHVRFVAQPSGDHLVEITPEGQALFDELSTPQAAVESDVPPLFRLHRTSRPAEDRTRFIGADAARRQCPRLAFLLDADPPWKFRTLDTGAPVASCERGEMDESLWVIDEGSTGNSCRQAPRRESDPVYTFRGLLNRLAIFLDASSCVDGVE